MVTPRLPRVLPDGGRGIPMIIAFRLTRPQQSSAIGGTGDSHRHLAAALPAQVQVSPLRFAPGARNDIERAHVIPRPTTGLPEGRPRNTHDLRYQSLGLRPRPRPPSPVTHGPLTARSGASRVGRAQNAGGL